ncbi:MAG: hypothetical protein JXQ73_13900 [Phycisphaerae bacterium]|nr:hypothetical protein [Phycisphaerae bacterium]
MYARLAVSLMTLGILLTQTGCITTSIVLGAMLVGAEKPDKATNELAEQLKGNAPSEADRVLGARMETLVDARQPGRELLIYGVKGDQTGAERYAVDVDRGVIAALTKGRQKTGDMEAAVKAEELRARLIGKTQPECEQLANIGKPQAVLNSRERNQTVRIYSAKKLEKAKGARYCVLRFNPDGRCAEVNLIGIQSSTKKDPTKG